MSDAHKLIDELVKHKMVLSMGEARRMLAQGAIRIQGMDKPLHVESLHATVNVGDVILVGCKKSFIVTEENES